MSVTAAGLASTATRVRQLQINQSIKKYQVDQSIMNYQVNKRREEEKGWRNLKLSFFLIPGYSAQRIA